MILTRPWKKASKLQDAMGEGWSSKVSPCFTTGQTTGVSHGQKYKLVGGLEHFLFFHILGLIIPTD